MATDTFQKGNHYLKLSRRSLLVECYHGTSALLNYKEVNEQNVL